MNPARRATDLAAALAAHRSTFKAFLTARVGSEAEAEDILQNGLLKALQRSDNLQNDAKLTAWFYQVLRNAVVSPFTRRSSSISSHPCQRTTQPV